MKNEEKKQEAVTVAGKPVQSTPPKQSSGDKSFDEAIDKMLKKPIYQTPGK